MNDNSLNTSFSSLFQPTAEKTPVYIAAPFAAARGFTVEDNVLRARGLLQHALEKGYAPVHVHDAILAGSYGSDDDPEARERGLQVCEAIVNAVIRAEGEVWALTFPDGTLSTGVQRECDLALALRMVLARIERPFVRIFHHNPDDTFTELETLQ